jgi:hypothetical protein
MKTNGNRKRKIPISTQNEVKDELKYRSKHNKTSSQDRPSVESQCEKADVPVESRTERAENIRQAKRKNRTMMTMENVAPTMKSRVFAMAIGSVPHSITNPTLIRGVILRTRQERACVAEQVARESVHGAIKSVECRRRPTTTTWDARMLTFIFVSHRFRGATIEGDCSSRDYCSDTFHFERRPHTGSVGKLNLVFKSMQSLPYLVP